MRREVKYNDFWHVEVCKISDYILQEVEYNICSYRLHLVITVFSFIYMNLPAGVFSFLPQHREDVRSFR